MMHKISCLLIFSFLLVSCGSKKNIVDSSAEAKNLSSLENKLETKKPDFKALNGVMSVNFKTEENSVNLRVNFRIKKDSAIWMSAKIAGLIPIAKALITPNKVSFYQKINKEYFEGDYTLIEDLLGVPINYDQLQKLILGQALINPFQSKAQFSQDETYYFIRRSYNQQLSYQSSWLKKSLDLKKQHLVHQQKDQQLFINYDQYEYLSGNSYPVDYFILASDVGSQVRIGIKVKKIEQVNSINLPFSIPDNYTKMSL